MQAILMRILRPLVPIVLVALGLAVLEARPTSAVTSQAVQTVSFRAAADAHVSASTPARNYGRAARLTVGRRTRAYLRFRVAGVRAPIGRAVLRLYVVRGGGQLFFHPVGVDNWREHRVTHGRAPRLGRRVGGAPVPTAKGWATFDVTTLVQRAGSITIGLSSSRPVAFSSREARRAPELHVNGNVETIVLAAGDIADCNSQGDEATARLVERLPGTVLLLGDIAYPSGRPEDFRCYDASWGKFKARTRPAVGNHEYLTPGASPYFDYFGAAAGDRDKGYYSFDLGEWHIIAVNSNCNRVRGCRAGSAQERWLRADLAATSKRCTLAFWHHPLFSSGQHGAHSNMRPIWDALYEARAELVLAGHDHHYERFAPQTPSGAPDANGIRQFVVGTGGKNYTRIHSLQPNSEVRAANVFGVLELRLSRDGYRWRFVPEAGKTFTDSGSGVCR
jgi:hypothetical protein